MTKWRQKHGLFVFSDAHIILRLMLCNRNLAKLVYPTLCRAWAWKLSEDLKKKKKITIKVGPKRPAYYATIRTINKCKIPYMRKNTFLCKNALPCIINTLPVVLEIIISYFFLLFENDVQKYFSWTSTWQLGYSSYGRMFQITSAS